MKKDTKEFRCPWCGALIFKYKLQGSLTVEIKCNKCKNKSLYNEKTN